MKIKIFKLILISVCWFVFITIAGELMYMFYLLAIVAFIVGCVSAIWIANESWKQAMLALLIPLPTIAIVPLYSATDNTGLVGAYVFITLFVFNLGVLSYPFYRMVKSTFV
ncbi:hypothetical protein SAMN02745866_04293 [Alteromonadaceae bacterium Bs31]|nr:hypothetical protein SAMN02745866_04293 [Alteromonadaceae bacterium Bs31]